jgi:ABC-type sugar transport system permease subunit/ABC-type glycerol-3-phosphate transport system substrate-binding protein
MIHRLIARSFPGVAATFIMLTVGALRLGATELDIPVFAGGYGLSFYEETARKFEALRPGVKVHLYGDPRIGDKIAVRAIAGNYPDAALAAYVPWPQLARAGKVLDLAKYLDGPNWENDARWRDTFLPGSLDTWRIDGRVYGLPFSYACWTIFYNRAMFRAHGWIQPHTWDEFFALCDKIKAAGIAPVSLTGTRGLYPDAFLRAAYYNLAGPEGWRAMQNLAPGARNDPRYIRAAGVLQRITQNYALRGWDGASHTGAQLAFLDGRAAMTVSGSWMVNEMEGKIPADFEMGAMNFPVFPDGVADPTAIQAQSDCFFLFLNTDPEREKQTVDFLRFLTSRERAEAFVRSANSPVSVRGVPRSAFSPQMQDTVAMIEHAKEAFNMPQVMLQPHAVRQALTDGRVELMTGAITPQQFGDQLESAAANDRARAANPSLVEFNHPLAGASLLVVLAGIGLWLIRGGRRPPGGGGLSDDANRRPEVGGHLGSYFARLRAPVALGFVGPAFALYAALVLLPGLAAFAWAFTRWDGLGPRSWVGLFNFKWLLFEDNTFWSALGNNLYLMVVPALIVVPLALLFATLLHRGIWGGRVFRVVFLFPNMLGGIAATLLWLNAYEPNGGLVNASLVALGRLLGIEWLQSFDGFPWLAPSHLYVALVPIYLWMACGFNLILYLAAMEGIDPQLYEAAELDGAPAWRQFFTITLPMIWEAVVISAVFIVISGLNAFEMVWLLTSQEPNSSTHTLGTLMVTAMFKDFEVGRATAIAVVLFLLVLAASSVVLRGLKREAVE